MSKESGEEQVHHPHDNFNRRWFGDPQVASDVLKVIVPDSLKPLIAPEKLKLEGVSFIDQSLRPTQSDLLWKCSGADDSEIEAFFYILWEHQSRV